MRIYFTYLYAVSGVVPEEPVYCNKSGHIYEKRLIIKQIETTGKDPITNDDISIDDLLPIKSNKAIKPRPTATMSVHGLLSTLQSEWDNLMLETAQLKLTLDSTRQELSQALYQHDAACRVLRRSCR